MPEPRDNGRLTQINVLGERLGNSAGAGGSRGIGMSTRNDGKIRYALGLFAHVGDLERAIRDLLAAGLPLAQLKVIAPPKAAGPDAGWGERMAALGASTWIVSEATGPCPWNFAPAGNELPSGGHTSGTRYDVIPNFHIWALERHALQLDRHLRSGGGIAVVQVLTDEEERAAYATLLRYATAGVQTHEISNRPGD